MSRLLAPVLLALLGVSLLANPVYLSFPSGEKLHPTFEEVDGSTCRSTVAYSDLPPRARHSFDITSHGDMPNFSDTLYTGTHPAAVEAFREHDCVSRDGSYFDVYLIHRDSFFPDPMTLVSPVLSGVGGLVLLGAVALFVEEWRTE